MMDAVRILLDRMDTHPEEFTPHGPWAGIINAYRDLIPPDETELLNEKINEARTKQFTAAVIEQLMRGNDPKTEWLKSGMIGVGVQIPHVGVTAQHISDPLVYKTTNRYSIGDTE
jgi:hypothetical protein